MSRQWVDLSQPFYPGMPTAKILPPPRIQPMMTHERDRVAVTELCIHTHMGTHVDAPLHLVAGGKSIDQIDFRRLIGPAVVLDLSRSAREAITGDDLEEEGRGVRPGDMLFIRTGWGSHYHESDYLENPYLTEEAARWCVERRVHAVGIDAVTPEAPHGLRPPDFNWPVHQVLLRQEILVVENLNLEAVAGRRLLAVGAPLLIRSADGSPCRMVAQYLDE